MVLVSSEEEQQGGIFVPGQLHVYLADVTFPPAISATIQSYTPGFGPAGLFDFQAATGHLPDRDPDRGALTDDEIDQSYLGDVLDTTGAVALFQARVAPAGGLVNVLADEWRVYLRDVATGPTSYVNAPEPYSSDLEAIRPTLSADVSRVAYSERPFPPVPPGELDLSVEVRDVGALPLPAGFNPRTFTSFRTLAGNGTVERPMLSGDGSLIVFNSNVDFVAGGAALYSHVFGLDLSTPLSGIAVRVSVNTAGDEATGGDSLNADVAEISGQQSVAVFESDATNLLGPGGDTNGKRDIFVRVDDLTGTDLGFVRGDANSDGSININDPNAIIADLFGGGPPVPCDDAADANDDGVKNISDSVYLLNWLFDGQAPPPPPSSAASPYPSTDCGTDPTPDGLGCASSASTCIVF